MPPGTQGEVVCRGYNVMKGYYNMPEATAEAIDAEGWLHSGDLGTVDEDGYFKITGTDQGHDHPRRGEHLSPRDRGVPPHDARHQGRAGGRDCQREVRRGGGRVRRPARTGRAFGEEDVRDFCRGKISRFKIPRYVFFVDAFPMTGSGKIQKYKLREMGLKLLSESGAEVV